VVALELIGCLQRLTAVNGSSKWKGFVRSLKVMWCRNKIEGLAKQADCFRSQLSNHLATLDRLTLNPPTAVRFDAVDQTQQTVISSVDHSQQIILGSINHSNEVMLNGFQSIATRLDFAPSVVQNTASAPRTATMGQNTIVDGSPVSLNQHDAVPSGATLPADNSQIEMLIERFERLEGIVSSGKRDGAAPAAACTAMESEEVRQSGDAQHSHKSPAPLTRATELSKSIAELSLFASKSNTTLFFEDATTIIRCLDDILAMVEGEATPKPRSHSDNGKRKGVNDYDECYMKLERVPNIKRIRGLVSAAQSVVMNKPGNTRRYSPPLT